MAWQFENNLPIYTQILEQIRLGIISGVYPAGSKLPSVRELASEASVNPNTMQRALAELEQSGLIYTQRTAGRFVTEDLDMIGKLKKNIAEEQIRKFFQSMLELGFTEEETIQLMEKAVKETKL
ncbi:GntR family transcriptional regulator [Clostridium sp. AN503]|uniref:GntR family transcriptional regulator n=1 Tax=Clostridium sp. AN503 TaxID=3160598 RepID=UPI00345A10FD